MLRYRGAVLSGAGFGIDGGFAINGGFARDGGFGRDAGFGRGSGFGIVTVMMRPPISPGRLRAWGLRGTPS